MAQITLDELAVQAGIKDVDLDQQCSNDDFLSLYDLCDPWDLIGQHLKLTRSQISAVDGDNQTTDQKRLGVLQKWKEIFAHKATYRVLVTAFLACGKAEKALEVCKTLAQEKTATFATVQQTPLKPTVVSEPTEDDIINTPYIMGAEVVDLCIQKLKSSTFKDNTDFLRRVAYVMSQFGKNMENVECGGIWKVSYAAFQDTLDTNAHSRLLRKYEQIWKVYKIDWKSVKYKDLDKPFYSALAARLYLSNYPEYIPPAHQLQDQAEYWKFKYMSGSGDVKYFIEKVKELEQSHP